MKDDALRSLPRVDRVVAHPSLQEALQAIGVGAVTDLVRAALAEARRGALEHGSCPTADEVVAQVSELARSLAGCRTRAVINATGVVLHTNLGRAPLSAESVRALARTAGSYVALEMSLSTGQRGGRAAFAESMLARLAGAEAALVVNNNAAAVLLALSSVAGTGRGVLVSRGELVEIGGGFRIPEVLARSGARMIEVGTTNKTREEDYARAFDAETPGSIAALLRVHPGNFRQTGFVSRPALGALVNLARARGLAVIEDVGGGLLVDLGARGLEAEPDVRASVRAGADLVCFSTDKALGGPQGGGIVGRAALIDRLKRDPLARALRVGRLPLVALEATLVQIARGEIDSIPALAALRKPVDEVRARAERWQAELASHGVEVEVVAIVAVAGGGAFTAEPLASAGVALPGDSASLLARLREGDPPVIARIEADRVVLDARTVLGEEDDGLISAVVVACKASDSSSDDRAGRRPG